MAKATVERRQTEKTIIVTTDEPVYVVEMTGAEAQAVTDALGRCIGPDKSRWRHTKAVYQALRSAGTEMPVEDSDISGELNFRRID